jgi:hypothetical protein
VHDDIAKRQEVIAAFRWTQIRSFLLCIPLVAAGVVGTAAFDHPDNEIMGLSGAPLIFTLVGVGAASFLAFIYFWRCPACHASLGFQRGFSQSFCHRCGALFTKGTPEAGSDPTAFKKAQVDAAIKKDLGRYRSWLGIRMLRGIVLAITGLLLVFLARPEPGPAPSGATMLRTFGQHNTTLMMIGLGVLLTIAGAAVAGRSIWAMTKGAEVREKQARRFLNSR